MSGLVLSLFPGIGLLDMAFEEAGFCVVRGPDLLWGGDVRRFHPPAGRFDGVIGGPPCQAFSTMKRWEPLSGTKHGNMIPFLMENVEGAPLPQVASYAVHAQMLRDAWCGGETTRWRRFSFGSTGLGMLRFDLPALHRVDPEPAALASGGRREKPHLTKSGEVRRYQEGFKTSADFRNHCRLQGLPDDYLADAPFTVEAKIRVVGNGVPRAMGRAVAAAVLRALGADQTIDGMADPRARGPARQGRRSAPPPKAGMRLDPETPERTLVAKPSMATPARAPSAREAHA